MSFYVTAGKDIFPLTINRSRYISSDPCFSSQGTLSCPTWYVFGRIGDHPSRLTLNEFGVRGDDPNGTGNYLEIFFGSRTKYKGWIEFKNGPKQKTTLSSSLLEIIDGDHMNFSYDGIQELLHLYRYNYNSLGGSYELKYDQGKFDCLAYDQSSRSLLSINPYQCSVYAYMYERGTNAYYAEINGTWPQISAGYNLSYFGQPLSPNSAIAALGSTGTQYFGFKVASYNSSHEFGVVPSTDELLWSLLNRNGQYFGILVNNYETSYWAYDRYGTNLLWNSKGSGVFQIWNDARYNHFIISCSPTSLESSIWSKDSAGINLLWNSRKDGVLQLWQDTSSAYMAFYIKNQAGFWFSESYYTDLKFSNRAGILQIWNTSRQSYIDLSIYMLEYGHVATFNYVYCKGELLKGFDGKYVKIFSTHPIDICDPKKLGSTNSSDATKKTDPICAINYYQ